MKIFFGIFIVIVFTILGYLLGLKFLDRKKFYDDFLSFNKNFLEEISLKNSSIKEFLSENKKDSDFYNCIYDSVYNTKFSFNKNYLDVDEKKFFFDYVNSLGKNEIEEEKRRLNSYNGKLTEKFNVVLEEDKKFRLLYVKLGFLIGLIVFVIIL